MYDRPDNWPQRMKSLLIGLLYLPAIVAVITLSIALVLVSVGLIVALAIVLRSIPSKAYELGGLTVPLIIGGITILAIAALVFLVRVVIGAEKAIPTRKSEIVSSIAPLAIENPRAVPPSLSSGRIVDEVGGSSSGRRLKSVAVRQTKPLVMWSTTILAGVIAGVIFGAVFAEQEGSLGWIQFGIGFVVGLAASVAAYLVQRFVVFCLARR